MLVEIEIFIEGQTNAYKYFPLSFREVGPFGARLSLTHSLILVATDPKLKAFFDSCIHSAIQEARGSFQISGLKEHPYPGAYTDFYGLPSIPRCVFKTGEPWRVSTTWRIIREARPVCDHPMQNEWLRIGQLVYEHLDSLNVEWSSIDPVRFSEAKKEDVSELLLWIGVIPETLAFEAAKDAAKDCKDILVREGFPDVEVAFRESVVTQSTGAKLLACSRFFDPVPELRSPFTPALGLQIAPLKTPYYEGTGAVYLRESSHSARVFLLTANHVARPPPVHGNKPLAVVHKHKIASHEKIIVLGSDAHTKSIMRIENAIGSALLSIDIFDGEIKQLGPFVEGEEPEKTRARESCEETVEMKKMKVHDCNKIHDEVTKSFPTANHRVIGYVVHAPSIGIDDGPRHFTRDWALIELDRDKIDWDTFQGNKIFVGDKISLPDFISKMHPHPEGQSEFNYPHDMLLQISGVLKDDEIHNPEQLDANGEKCLIVIKNGKTTGPTIGRLSSMESFVRTYHPESGIKQTSIEIGVYAYSNEARAFSAPGDSGSIVVDSKGRIVGMIVAGAGGDRGTDVTYLTPYWWIEEEMKKSFPDILLYEAVD
ncbi:hypothetical protein M413DRAFT_32388 [Hebeloma cylindrosporum]|uniref:Peptidase S1 domain-containing protein n=1 Tax=Hebeloma cylindrosporum TaxID=76867 RepID=A0A0C3BFZ5_HEBCY|nr:hypothetical protein M413DRAFT_32388 [Hebeloma cylindrosporum h7]